jgi:hypothetical protein
MEAFPLDSTGAVAIAAVVILLLVVAKRLADKRRLPPNKSFRCARCSTIELHSRRTISAWRSGKTRLFCRSCHSKWLETRTVAARPVQRSSSSGCMGALLLFILIPVLLLGASFYAYRIA